MKICSTCIVPENFPKIDIRDGICSFCQVNNQRLGKLTVQNREDELKKLLADTPQGKYHCLVPISGGKDSTYILYFLVTRFGLNPLAVFFDNGFCTDYAKSNVQEICRKLKVDLVIRHASGFRRKLIREAWYVSYYSGKIFGFCGNCENNLRTSVINEARQQGIRYIIWGSTDFEDNAQNLLSTSAVRFRDSFAGKSSFRNKLISFMKSIARLFLKERISFAAKIKTLLHRIKYLHYYVMDNLTLKSPGGLEKFSPFFEVSFNQKRTETLYFYDYIPYNPIQQIKILEQEVGWKGPTGREAKMDCKLHHIGNYEHLKRTGITDTGFKLSVMVRNGMISREEAFVKEQHEIDHLKSYFNSDDLAVQQVMSSVKDLIFVPETDETS